MEMWTMKYIEEYMCVYIYMWHLNDITKMFHTLKFGDFFNSALHWKLLLSKENTQDNYACTSSQAVN